MARVIVVGGGVSGLTTAYRLQGHPDLDVQLVEAEPRFGGTVGTLQREGFLIDTGPNGYLDSRPDIVALVRELGLEARQTRAADLAKKRFTVRDGRLVALPGNPLAFLRSPVLRPRGRLRVLAEPLVRKPPAQPDESVFEFACRRVGREFAERLIDPMVRGVFAGDPHRLSLKSTFPRMAALEAEYGSLSRALVSLMRQRRKQREKGPNPAGFGGILTSFPQGIQELADRLVERLGDRAATGQRLTRLARTDGTWRLTLASAQGTTERRAEAVVLALPAYRSAELLEPGDAGLAALLRRIPYAPVAVVSLGYERADVAHPLDGFGFVTAAVEKPFMLGCLFTSTIFPGQAPANRLLLRCMVGGTRDPERVALPDEELFGRTVRELDALLGIRGEPLVRELVRWPQGIPQYHLGHAELIAQIDRRLAPQRGLFLTGNAYRGVSLNDCVREAGATARQVLALFGIDGH